MTKIAMVAAAAEDVVDHLDSVVYHLDQMYFDDVIDPNEELLGYAYEHLGRLAEALAVALGSDDLPPGLQMRLRDLRVRS